MKIYKDENVTQWTAVQVQSRISFQVRHLMVSHIKGEFTQFEANVLTNGRDFSTADITLNIRSKSIDTGDSKRDELLKSADFLKADEHKQIVFRSTSISRTEASEKMELHGDLKIAGITRSIKLQMQIDASSIDSWGDETASFTITGKLTRADWELGWTKAMEAAGFLMGDEVIVSCKIELNSVGQHDAQPANQPMMRVSTF